MKNILKLTGVPMLAIMATANANAAGYTCEELIEYTSCNPGYYLYADACGDNEYPVFGLCDINDGELYFGLNEEECNKKCSEYEPNNSYDECWQAIYVGDACVFYDFEMGYIGADFSNVTTNCLVCPAGSKCAGGTEHAKQCSSGTYQPSTGQSSCLTTPAGNYSDAGATNYTACDAGTYQPNAGQDSCLDCPTGSYCGTTGLTTVSGECAIGSFAPSGSHKCYACPVTGLTDKNGDAVMATTATTGAGSFADCFVDPNAMFVDDKGTYHFKSNCKYTEIKTIVPTGNKCPADYYLAYDQSENANQDYVCVHIPEYKCHEMHVYLEDYDVYDIWWDEATNKCKCYGDWIYDEYGITCSW